MLQLNKHQEFMFRKYYLFILLPLFVVAGIILVSLLTHADITLLNPKGTISYQERTLAVTAVFIMFVVVVPVFILAFLIARRYSESNKKAKYMPDWDRSRLLVFAWWMVPSIIVIILGINNWKATHALDPFKPLVSNNKPIKIQVISLQWKWLFIYPDENIATVNYIEFPEKTPVNFELTSDAPMNSFWIPALGGQMYSMTGMSTKLHLMADTVGEFKGSAAEISGRGFTGMKFMANSVTREKFDAWVKEVKKSPKTLDSVEYKKLAVPSEDTPPALYSSVKEGLYNEIIMKYMPEKSNN